MASRTSINSEDSADSFKDGHRRQSMRERRASQLGTEIPDMNKTLTRKSRNSTSDINEIAMKLQLDNNSAANEDEDGLGISDVPDFDEDDDLPPA